MPDGLYEHDVLIWSEHQADLLRRLAAGDRLNDTIDWPNVIEEIEGVGRSQLSTVKSLLVQALAHDLKCEAWPLAPYVPHWRAEARGFRGDATEAFTPSMRQRIDVDELYKRALDRLPDSVDGQPPLPLPATCPVTLDELLGDGH
jgi:hypothetical protein